LALKSGVTPVGKVVQPLQSVKYHDSRAHSYERDGTFTRLVGLWLGCFWLGLSWSSRFGLWHVIGGSLWA
jgi:hypothetical protein